MPRLVDWQLFGFIELLRRLYGSMRFLGLPDSSPSQGLSAVWPQKASPTSCTPVAQQADQRRGPSELQIAATLCEAADEADWFAISSAEPEPHFCRSLSSSTTPANPFAPTGPGLGHNLVSLDCLFSCPSAGPVLATADVHAQASWACLERERA